MALQQAPMKPKTQTPAKPAPTPGSEGGVRKEAGIMDLFGSGKNESGVGVSGGENKTMKTIGAGLEGAGKEARNPTPAARQYAPMTSLSGNSRSQPIEIQNVSPRYEALKRLSR